jgi:hypothetical protein
VYEQIQSAGKSEARGDSVFAKGEVEWFRLLAFDGLEAFQITNLKTTWLGFFGDVCMPGLQKRAS